MSATPTEPTYTLTQHDAEHLYRVVDGCDHCESRRREGIRTCADSPRRTT